MNLCHVSFGASPIRVCSITDYGAGALGWGLFGNNASLRGRVVNNIKLVGKCRRR
jgi:hypothetical protein